MPPLRIPSHAAPAAPKEGGSLRSFHVVFVCCSGVLAALLGVWGTLRYLESGGFDNLAIAVCGWSALFILLIYGRWFVRKMRALMS